MGFTIKTRELSKCFDRTVKEGKKTKKEEFLAVNKISIEAKSGEIVGISFLIIKDILSRIAVYK